MVGVVYPGCRTASVLLGRVILWGRIRYGRHFMNELINGDRFAAASRTYGIPVSISLALTMIIAALCAVQVSAQAACPTGTVAIGADRAIATANGIPTSSQCWNPGDQNVGAAAGDAKSWLKQHATSGANISCLNAQFAEKLKTFMQAVPGGVPTITDAYRGKAAQAQAQSSGASQLGPCGSYHQYGLAADFNNTNATTLRWMRLNAPQYGLAPTGVDPTSGCGHSGFCDPGHIQMAGSLPAADQCGVCNSAGGDGVLPATNGAQTPGGAIAKALNSLFNPNANSTPANSCIAQSVCSGNVLMYQDATCAMTVQQTCTSGCANGACTQSCATGSTLVNGTCTQTQQSTQSSSAASSPSSASGSTGSTGSASTPTVTTSTVTSPTSTAALLQALADSQSSGATTASNTPITLSGAAQNITQLSAPADSNITYAQTGSSGMSANGSGPADTGNMTGQQPQSNVSTFTSDDMANTGVSNTLPSALSTATDNELPILAALKAEVLTVVSFLSAYVQPFGGVVPNHISSE